jgi:hypothetical protein
MFGIIVSEAAHRAFSLDALTAGYGLAAPISRYVILFHCRPFGLSLCPVYCNSTTSIRTFCSSGSARHHHDDPHSSRHYDDHRSPTAIVVVIVVVALSGVDMVLLLLVRHIPTDVEELYHHPRAGESPQYILPTTTS